MHDSWMFLFLQGPRINPLEVDFRFVLITYKIAYPIRASFMDSDVPAIFSFHGVLVDSMSYLTYYNNENTLIMDLCQCTGPIRYLHTEMYIRALRFQPSDRSFMPSTPLVRA